MPGYPRCNGVVVGILCAIPTGRGCRGERVVVDMEGLHYMPIAGW